MGKGGGQPTQTTNYNTNVPEYARPYVERMLGKTEALASQPYQPYQGQRIAGFNPLQKETFGQYENRQQSGQVGMGSNLAAGAGLNSMAAGQNYVGMATNPNATQAFMNPYVSNALNPALADARRQSEITGQQNASQAVQQGAFGGSRFGIMEAERQRNLAQEQNKMLSQGYANAFENAQKAQQFGSEMDLRGQGQAIQAAGQLGQLGQQAFGQESEILKGRQTIGAAQQAASQEQLTQQYQDFLSQRGYPQQMLAFMSDMTRGVPLSQQTQQQYTAAPPMSSQIANLGLGAYGISQMMKKKGGVVKSFAEGGIASVDVNKLRGMLSEMSPEQLAQVKEGATDAVTLSLVESQEALNQRIRNAQALSEEMPTQTVKDELLAQGAGIEGASRNEFGDTAVGEQALAPTQEEPQMARGGLAAFAKGGKSNPRVEASPPPPPPDPSADAAAAIKGIDFTAPAITEEERNQAADRALARRQAAIGEDPNKPLLEQYMKEVGTGTPDNERNAMLAFSAMKHFAQPAPFMTALGNAGAGLGEDIAKFKKESKEAKRAAMQAQMEYNKAVRAEKIGNFDKAEDYGDKAEAKKEAARGKELEKQKTLAEIAGKDKDLANRLAVADLQGQWHYKSAVASASAGANKTTDFRDAKETYTQQGVAQFEAKNGRKPNAAEMTNIRAEATERAARALKSGFDANDVRQDQNNAANVAKSEELANKNFDTLSPQERKRFRELDKETGKPAGYHAQQWKEKEARRIQAQMGGANTSTTQPPPVQQPQYREGQRAKARDGREIVYKNGQWEFLQ